MTTMIAEKMAFDMAVGGQRAPQLSARMEYADPEEWQARQVRRQWMRMMGLSSEEIEEHCDARHGPALLFDELISLAAAKRLQNPGT